MTCQGITKAGKDCSYKGKYDGYCGFHKDQRPDSDEEEEPKEKKKPVVKKKKVKKEIKENKEVEHEGCKVTGCKYPRYEESLNGEFCVSHTHQYRFECDTDCPICMDTMDQTLITPLECGHWFHKECLMKCERAICPTCREPHNLAMPRPVPPQRDFRPLQVRLGRDDLDSLAELFRNLSTQMHRSRELLASYGRLV